MKLAAVAGVGLLALVTLAAGESAADTVRHHRLAAPTELQGFPCDRPAAFLHPDGRLSTCRLAREAVVGRVRIPTGSIIHLGDRGTVDLVWLSRDTEIAGLRCRGRRPAHLAEPAELHPNGALKSCALAADAVVQGVPCASGRAVVPAPHRHFFAVYLHESGRLQRCRLSRDLDGRRPGAEFTPPP
jgi:hypothetical protein